MLEGATKLSSLSLRRNFILKNRNVLFTNKFRRAKFMIGLRFSFQFQSTCCGENHRVPFVGFHLTHMWAVKTIPEVFCMFSIHFHTWMYSWRCWKIMQHLFLQTRRFASITDRLGSSFACNYIWKNNFSSHCRLISRRSLFCRFRRR